MKSQGRLMLLGWEPNRQTNTEDMEKKYATETSELVENKKN